MKLFKRNTKKMKSFEEDLTLLMWYCAKYKYNTIDEICRMDVSDRLTRMFANVDYDYKLIFKQTIECKTLLPNEVKLKILKLLNYMNK